MSYRDKMRSTGRKRNYKRQDVRKEEAAVRQEAYDKLTPDQKIAKLDRGGYAARNERARIKVGG